MPRQEVVGWGKLQRGGERRRKWEGCRQQRRGLRPKCNSSPIVAGHSVRLPSQVTVEDQNGRRTACYRIWRTGHRHPLPSLVSFPPHPLSSNLLSVLSEMNKRTCSLPCELPTCSTSPPPHDNAATQNKNLNLSSFSLPHSLCPGWN